MKEIFSALSDANRLKILDILKDKDMTQKEIQEKLGFSQPVLSYHMDKLLRSGLVISVKKGRNVVYSLNMSVLDMVLEYLFKLRKKGGET